MRIWPGDRRQHGAEDARKLLFIGTGVRPKGNFHDSTPALTLLRRAFHTRRPLCPLTLFLLH